VNSKDVVSYESVPQGGSIMAGQTHMDPILTSAIGGTGGFTVDPGNTFNAISVPRDKVFVLTDVFVFPLVTKHNPDFVVRYRVQQSNLTKFQYNTVGTEANWSQHFTSGIVFSPGSTVRVVNTSISTGRTGFQLLGYFTNP
jgi:hypothetical protein